MNLSIDDFNYLGLCLEGLFFGIYSAIFFMYLHCHAPNKDADKTRNTILFYALCVLYVLSLATIVGDISTFVIVEIFGLPDTVEFYISDAINGCCDFISQSILIYRCWIVWSRNIRVVIIPSILAFSFLAIWLSANGAIFVLQGQLESANWGNTVIMTSLALSMSVNALVTGLIVFKIFKVFRKVEATSDEKFLGASGGSKLRSIIFILIESGMALFSIQLARLVVTIVTTIAAEYAYLLIAPIHSMLNGITPTIILVRVSMGLSFHDEKSMAEVTESLCFKFAPDHSNPLSETESTDNIRQESWDDDVGVRRSNESNHVQMVDSER